MFKVITFAKLTDKGRLLPPEQAPLIWTKVQDIVRAYGGKVEWMWATTGRFDFVFFTEYANEPAAFKACVKITELGLFQLETMTAFPIETYIEAVQEKKVLVGV